MRQKEIWYADLNPTRGREQKGVRPVVVISGNAMNDHSDLCIVCPLTSKIKNYATCLVLSKDLLNHLKSDSEVLTFQVRTISKDRLSKKIGEITTEHLRKILEGLVDVLQY